MTIVFINERIPIGIDIGAISSPTFSATTNEDGRGREQTNCNWSQPIVTGQIIDINGGLHMP